MENILLDKITPNEYKMMDNWRNWYGWSENSTSSCNPIDIKEILSICWAKDKQTLFKLLGENLIISREFSYEKSEDELIKDISKVIYDNTNTDERNGYVFRNNYNNWIKENFIPPYREFDVLTGRYLYESEEQREKAIEICKVRNGLNELISLECLATNKYDGKTFSFPLKDNKIYTVQKGCKPMRVLSKIANSFGIEGFEDFRISHSLVHNQKKISGNVTLSIHPLDFWTMSDNNNDWESCMSWRETGCYRQGTMEMMNSPSVVVAYIDSKTPMTIGKDKWNNKKWRQLFIVDKDVILGIKSYPYFNKDLTINVTKWLKELAETNMGWTYFGDTNDEPIEYQSNLISIPECEDEYNKIMFDFCSNLMYTDVGCCTWHPMYVGRHINEKNLNTFDGYKYTTYTGEKVIKIVYNYSGRSQCVSCGSTINEFDTESCLCCVECQVHFRCSECDYSLDPDYCYTVQGRILCEECYNELVRTCFVCEEEQFMYEMNEISIYIPVSEQFQKKLLKEGYTEPKEGYKLVPYFSVPIYVCKEHMEEFYNKYLNKDATLQFQIESWVYSDSTLLGLSVKDINLNEKRWSMHMPSNLRSELSIAQSNNDYDTFADKFCYHVDIKRIKSVEDYSVEDW